MKAQYEKLSMVLVTQIDYFQFFSPNIFWNLFVCKTNKFTYKHLKKEILEQ